MTATPGRQVHWGLDASLSDFGSPFSESPSSESISSTSSLQYINSQLIAHGFAHQPGLSLEGLGKVDVERVVKCLLSMLGQRMDDMSRTEDLTTKIRTLSYDHERLQSMYRTSTEKAANAEREMNVHKSRLASTTRSLHSAEAATKHTTAELQRTRTALQALRTAHQTEIKKLEKEKERMTERWNKLSDSQLKAGGLSSGLTCANAIVVEASDLQLRGGGRNFLEDSLEQAEQAREALFEQNHRLRSLLLTTANELQRVHFSRLPEGRDEPTPLTLSTLFPASPAEVAGVKISTLLASVKEAVSQLAEAAAIASVTSLPVTIPNSAKEKERADEVEKLQKVVETLRTELEQAQKQTAAYSSETQALFDQFAQGLRLHGEVGEMSTDLITCTVRDEEKQRLDARAKALDEERRNFTEAAVKLGKEKAALEAERIKFLEEKRSWQVDMILADLPPTPAPSSQTVPAEQPSSHQISLHLPPASPRRSPRKAKAGGIVVGKASSTKKTRVSRRSSGLGVISPRKVIPAFETEVMPSPSLQLPSFKTSMAAALGQPPPLPGAFVLPPPSPAASLARPPDLSSIPPLSSLSIPLPQPIPVTSTSQSTQASTLSGPHASVQAPVPVPVQVLVPIAVPSTPHRPFPMAKPLAQRMIHAYSPVRPSPLSRILMLANSPTSPEDRIPQLNVLQEEDESGDADDEVSPTPASAHPPTMSLAAELGVSDDELALREKRPGPNVVKPKAARPLPQKPTLKSKGKGRAEPAPVVRAGPVVPTEKENVKRAKSSVSASGTASAAAQQDRKPSKPAPKMLAAAPRPKLAGKGGARRVPINSAEAAPVGAGWKG